MSHPSTTFDAGAEPPWSPFSHREQLQTFWTLAVDAARTLGTVEPDLGEGLLIVGEGLDVLHCGVINLAQLCAEAEPTRWEGMVERHFQFIRGDPLAAALARLSDYQTARRHLRLRLAPTPVVEEVDAHRIDLPDNISIALAIDMDGHCVYVSSEHTKTWGPTGEELLMTAAEQNRRKVRVHKRSRHRHGGEHLHLHGASLFLTGHLFDLRRYVPDTGPMGVLVSAPTARELLVVPVGDGPVFADNIVSLMGSTFSAWSDGPNSLSTAVRWWRQGFDLEPAFRMSNGVEMVAPEPLAGVIRTMMSES
ncbi:MAG: hypothetical protein P8N02_13700 [Actinomycetota bacterium]|nr:hypothetical protein [Actinomycetota bacterium]